MDHPFILGIETSVENPALLTTEALYDKVGHNTGNLAFHYAIDQQLGGNLKSIRWSSSVESINASGDISVLPCANQLGPHVDLAKLAEKFSKLSPSIVAIGLGAQSGPNNKIPEVPKGTLNWVQSIIDHAPNSAPNISVRGKFTLEVLEHYGLADHATILGCPSLFINPEKNLGALIAERLKEPKRIAVAAGHPRWTHLSRIEASLAHMVTATNGSYIGQSPVDMIKLTRGEADQTETELLTASRDYACPEMDLEEFILWSKIHGNTFFSTPSWMEHYRKYDFIVGTRIHGIMLALQAGIPALCIVHDSRTLELCQTMEVPHVLAKNISQGIQRKDLLKLFNFDPGSFDRNRAHLCRKYVDFLNNNHLMPTSWLTAIASDLKATGHKSDLAQCA